MPLSDIVHQNEGGLARLPVRHPLGALDSGLTGDYFEEFWILGGRTSKGNYYDFAWGSVT